MGRNDRIWHALRRFQFTGSSNAANGLGDYMLLVGSRSSHWIDVHHLRMYLGAAEWGVPGIGQMFDSTPLLC